MTAREMFEYSLIECNKLGSPTLLLEDYNYFGNKAVQQYINIVYNRYEINQQSTDDLRVLKASTVLPLSKTDPSISGLTTNMLGNSYITKLPKDYLHLLNCIVDFNVVNNSNCYTDNTSVQFVARRLTSDIFSGIINNAYFKPSYKRPYYYINNFNNQKYDLPSDENTTNQIPLNANEIEDKDNSTIDALKSIQNRTANVTDVLLEIRFGNDNKSFIPKQVYIDYIKAPQHIRLTQSQIDSVVDKSQILEFPEYACFEIVNILTKLLLENSSDPRLQTNIPVNQTIQNSLNQNNK